MLAIPGDTNGWCVVANEIKDKSKGESTDHPKKWLLSDEDEEVDIVLFTMPVADIRVALGDLDKCCHIKCDLNADILCMNTPQYNTTQ